MADQNKYRVNNIPQGNFPFKDEDGRKSPEMDPALETGSKAKLFDTAFRTLITLAMGNTLDETANNLKSSHASAAKDDVVTTFKALETHLDDKGEPVETWSKGTWKTRMNEEKTARMGQKRQMWAVDAINETLGSRMARA